jgi:hypothetical protein
MIVRAAIASAVLLTALAVQRGARSAPPLLPEACPSDLLARQKLPTVRAAVIASLWAPGKRCVVRADYAEPEAAPMLLPETARTQRASGHWARLAAAGYVFAENAPETRAMPAPVLRFAHTEARAA